MSARFVVREAIKEDRDSLLALVRSAAQDGMIQISYERDPDYFSALSVPSPNPIIWVLEDVKQNKIAGVFCLGKREVYLDGKRTPVWYGNELRLDPNYRGGRALLRLFKRYKAHMGENWMQTIIMGDNQKSLGSVASGRAGLPTYYPAGGITTHMISTRVKIKKQTEAKTQTQMQTLVRRVKASEVQAVQAFFDANAKNKQFCPHYNFDKIGTGQAYYKDMQWSDMFVAIQNQEIVGIAGIWDQSGFKQSRVRSYSPLIQWARPLYNVFAKLTANLVLPKIDHIVKYAYVHCVIILDNKPSVFSDLLSTMLYQAREGNLEALVVGFEDRDPLGNVLGTIKTRPMKARHFMASHGDNPCDGFDTTTLIYVEPARF